MTDPAIRALERLVRFEGDPVELAAQVERLGGWSLHEVVTVRRDDVVRVLRSLVEGRVAAGVVHAWADALEVQEAVMLEEAWAGEIDTLLCWLAEPLLLDGPLTPDLARKFLGMLDAAEGAGGSGPIVD